MQPSCLFKISEFVALRNCIRLYSSKLPEGIQYHGFTYYPRHEGFQDPPCKPPKLFLVRRIKSVRGTNKVEKEALTRLDIDGEKKRYGHVAVVKNIPQINALLWKVKHLIDIKPITYSGELPKDFNGTFLRQTGELVISPKLKTSDQALEKSVEYEDSLVRMKKHYLKELLRLRWAKGHYNI